MAETRSNAGNTVVVGSFDGNVYGLDAATGSEQWRFGPGTMCSPLR
ncbi:MAG: hypothetical protein FI701_09245 [SAR202 cluster bacterium]|nr:hypothetical protein [SAR202 cluster bacterium]